MIVEGVGNVAPKPKVIRLEAGTLALINRLGHERANFRNEYRRGNNKWKTGLTGDAVASIRIGLVGEFAASLWLNANGAPCDVDLSELSGGDGGTDLAPFGFRLQVKTQRGYRSSFPLRRIDHKRRLRPFDCDAFLFIDWLEKERPDKPQIAGWIPAETARRFGVSRSNVAPHFNVNVPRAALLRPERLIERLQSIKRCHLSDTQDQR